MAMAKMRRVCLASAVRAAAARNCEILRFWRVISIADMLPAPRINDVLHRVTLAAVWESPQESGSQPVGIISRNCGLPGSSPPINDNKCFMRVSPFDRCCRKIRFFAYRYGLSIEMHRQLLLKQS